VFQHFADFADGVDAFVELRVVLESSILEVDFRAFITQALKLFADVMKVSPKAFVVFPKIFSQSVCRFTHLLFSNLSISSSKIWSK